MANPWPNDHCKKGGKHTPCPRGYTHWHEWAERKSRTHRQVPCPECGLLAVWVRRADDDLRSVGPVIAAADFDRLRDERDRLAEASETLAAVEESVREGFAAGRAAATPDPPTDERRPWPIAPDTVMPPRRQPVRWGSRADDPPTEIHDDPEKTKAYLAGLAAGRTEAAAASPDERLREADRAALVESIAQTERFRGGPCLCSDCVEKRADAEATVDAVLAALAATDRDKQEGER